MDRAIVPEVSVHIPRPLPSEAVPAPDDPSLALLELSFKRVFIIRIVTMEEFFLLSILIYLKTTLT